MADLLGMDFDHPWALFSSIFIGIIGTVIFMYGKRQSSFRCLAAGAGLCIFPYFVTSVVLMWAITGAALGGLFVTREQ